MDLKLKNLHINKTRPGNHTHIFALTNSGKTNNAIQIALNLARNHSGVYLMQCELSNEALQKKIETVHSEYSQGSLNFDVINFNMYDTVETVISHITNAKQNNKYIRHLIIDYANLLKSICPSSNSRENNLNVMKELYHLANLYGFSLYLFHQANRELYNISSYDEFINLDDSIIKWIKSMSGDVLLLHDFGLYTYKTSTVANVMILDVSSRRYLEYNEDVSMIAKMVIENLLTSLGTSKTFYNHNLIAFRTIGAEPAKRYFIYKSRFCEENVYMTESEFGVLLTLHHDSIEKLHE